ncbi:MAG: hypothetical protein R3E54_12895 [Halioglobus sp.]
MALTSLTRYWLAACLLSVACSAANAGIITHIIEIDSQPPLSETNYQLPKFDPALGVISALSIDIVALATAPLTAFSCADDAGLYCSVVSYIDVKWWGRDGLWMQVQNDPRWAFDQAYGGLFSNWHRNSFRFVATDFSDLSWASVEASTLDWGGTWWQGVGNASGYTPGRLQLTATLSYEFERAVPSPPTWALLALAIFLLVRFRNSKAPAAT